MKIARTIAKQRIQWQELDRLCSRLEDKQRLRLPPDEAARFASLYRSACADLALADANQLPPNTIQYLHRLVGRSHNQLYRTRGFDFQAWSKMLLHDVPQTIFRDGCVKFAFVLFWGLFLLSLLLARYDSYWPDFAREVLGDQQINTLEQNFGDAINGRNADMNAIMASYYINNNTSIGLRCFVTGIFIVPGLVVTAFNAMVIGASFGYMARPDVEQGVNFFHFVTAHGPFELTAIVLSAGAGFRLGLSWMKTNGWTRGSSLRMAAAEAMPIMGASMLLFVFAAFIEGFLSPSGAPYMLKAIVAVLSSGLLLFYFIVLGYPRGERNAT